jgi:hypothetical protein
MILSKEIIPGEMSKGIILQHFMLDSQKIIGKNKCAVATLLSG